MSYGRFVSPLRERDGDDCWLCGQRIDFGLPSPATMSRTVDHVQPLAAGGRSVLANLRLAHRGCNIKRGSVWEGVNYGGRMAASKHSEKAARRKRKRVGAGSPEARFEAWSAALDAWGGGRDKPELPCM